jgi:hypothetical protein
MNIKVFIELNDFDGIMPLKSTVGCNDHSFPQSDTSEKLLLYCRICGSQSCGYEEFCLPGYNAVQSAEN